MLFAAGGALAIAQPGDLGEDGDDTAAPAQETTTTTAGSDLTTTTTVAVTPTVPGETTTTVAVTPTVPGETTTTVAVTPTVPGETTTTMRGSGLGEGTPPSGGTDGVANTGGESMIGAGMALGALGLLLRRATRTA